MIFHDDQTGPNTSTSFTDAIATVTIERQPSAQPCDWPYHQADAQAILSMPEMQALREMVCTYARWELDNDACQTKYETDEWIALPDHLKQWLMQWEGYK